MEMKHYERVRCGGALGFRDQDILPLQTRAVGQEPEPPPVAEAERVTVAVMAGHEMDRAIGFGPPFRSYLAGAGQKDAPEPAGQPASNAAAWHVRPWRQEQARGRVADPEGRMRGGGPHSLP